MCVSGSGDVRCVGGDMQGELGNGDAGESGSLVPTGVEDSLTAPSAGQSHTCVVRTAGHAWCWGANSVGQLGDGTTVDRPAPARVAGL